jgi:hypothetical protein
MTGNTLEQRARELLAAELRDDVMYEAGVRRALESGSDGDIPVWGFIALRAIEAALRLSAGADWQPIETAPNDGTPHVRGLWVTIKREGKPDEREWRYEAGYINDAGDFVDSDYGENFGWEPDQYDAWAPLPAAPRHETGEG